jgi:hypothetical protein
MTEKRIFPFRLPHQRDTDQVRECVADDVRGDYENRKAEQDERQPLHRFYYISLRERRMRGSCAPAERQLAKTPEGVEMVKRFRQNLIAQGRDKLCEQISEITGAKILGLFTDIDVQLGERVFVFTVDRELQNGNR